MSQVRGAIPCFSILNGCCSVIIGPVFFFSCDLTDQLFLSAQSSRPRYCCDPFALIGTLIISTSRATRSYAAGISTTAAVR
jgi:hypothetical protein